MSSLRSYRSAILLLAFVVALGASVSLISAANASSSSAPAPDEALLDAKQPLQEHSSAEEEKSFSDAIAQNLLSGMTPMFLTTFPESTAAEFPMLPDLTTVSGLSVHLERIMHLVKAVIQLHPDELSPSPSDGLSANLPGDLLTLEVAMTVDQIREMDASVLNDDGNNHDDMTFAVEIAENDKFFSHLGQSLREIYVLTGSSSSTRTFYRSGSIPSYARRYRSNSFFAEDIQVSLWP